MEPQTRAQGNDLKRRFISVFTDHPVLTILAVMVIGALLFGDLLT